MPFKLVDIVAIIAKAGAAAPFTNDMPVSLCEHCHGKLFLVLVNFSWFIGVHCEGCWEELCTGEGIFDWAERCRFGRCLCAVEEEFGANFEVHLRIPCREFNTF